MGCPLVSNGLWIQRLYTSPLRSTREGRSDPQHRNRPSSRIATSPHISPENEDEPLAPPSIPIMNQAYGRTNSSRNRFQEPTSFTQRIFDGIASSPAFRQWRQPEATAGSNNKKGLLRRWLSFVNVIILAWIVTIYWGERSVYSRSINACDWRHWESWVHDAWVMSVMRNPC
jgi:hypothetical protein